MKSRALVRQCHSNPTQAFPSTKVLSSIIYRPSRYRRSSIRCISPSQYYICSNSEPTFPFTMRGSFYHILLLLGCLKRGQTSNPAQVPTPTEVESNGPSPLQSGVSSVILAGKPPSVPPARATSTSTTSPYPTVAGTGKSGFRTGAPSNRHLAYSGSILSSSARAPLRPSMPKALDGFRKGLSKSSA